MQNTVHDRARRLSARSAGAGIALLLLAVACASDESERRGSASPSRSSAPVDVPTVEDRTAKLEPVRGLLPLYWDAAEARLLLEPAPDGAPLLHVVSLRSGLGSNDVGLDRGQLGDRRLVEFRTVGRRVLLVAPNLKYRNTAPSEVERAGVRESFAESVLHSFEIVARTAAGPGNGSGGARTLVDATDFFLADHHEIARKLRDAGQGDFQLDPPRSLLLPDELRGFPRNTEVEALLTFAGAQPGAEVRSTAADARSPSFRVHHSFLWLEPAPTYVPRAFHPRAGYIGLSYRDAAAAIDEPLEQRRILRHDLRRGADGKWLDPIVYYVDRAAPEPVRTALLEGARYWVPMFEQAGLSGGFRAELLPEGADPLDARYNVVQWVSRSTRGWSYGDTVSDPRTGEILKGHVTLGALRVRQDVLLMEGLLAPYPAEAGAPPDPRVQAVALARIRQLAAHEIGHTLGLAHNFAASTQGRSSVMDYPAPLVMLDPTGGFDVSDAYREGCGEWDELAILYGYGVWADEAGGLAAVLEAMSHWRYLSDDDARGVDRSHPYANLWDNGPEPISELERTFTVREEALERFSEAVLPVGRPLAELEEVLLPVYFGHRYQLEAAAKSLGGIEYEYAVRGDAPTKTAGIVSTVQQQRALKELLVTLEPAFLDLPAWLWEQHGIPPRPPGHGPTRELLQPGALHFDPLAAAAASANWTLTLLLDPARAARLLDQHRNDAALPGFEDVVRRLVGTVFGDETEVDVEDLDETPGSTLHHAAIRDEVRVVTLERLLALAADASAPVRVRAEARAGLSAVRAWAEAEADEPLAVWARERIEHFLSDPRSERDPGRGPERVQELPPGGPIGDPATFFGAESVELGCSSGASE